MALLASWRVVSPDRRPTWLALSMIGLLMAGLATPSVAGSLGFIQPMPGIWLLVFGGLLLWGLDLSLFWRKRWLEWNVARKNVTE